MEKSKLARRRYKKKIFTEFGIFLFLFFFFFLWGMSSRKREQYLGMIFTRLGGTGKVLLTMDSAELPEDEATPEGIRTCQVPV